MIKPVLWSLLLTVVSTTAFAGIVEKKAKRAADEAIAASVEATKAACGNAELSVTVPWEDFETTMATPENAKKMTSGSYTAERILKLVGSRTANSLDALAKICEDADYKEEVAKITAITLSPKTDIKDYRSEYSREASTIHIQTGYLASRSVNDFIPRLKALF